MSRYYIKPYLIWQQHVKHTHDKGAITHQVLSTFNVSIDVPWRIEAACGCKNRRIKLSARAKRHHPGSRNCPFTFQGRAIIPLQRPGTAGTDAGPRARAGEGPCLPETARGCISVRLAPTAQEEPLPLKSAAYDPKRWSSCGSKPSIMLRCDGHSFCKIRLATHINPLDRLCARIVWPLVAA